MTDTERHGEALVEYLVSLADREDRAALATLRSSFREGHTLDGLRIVLPFVRATPSSQKQREDDALLLGALFALHPEHGPLSLAAGLAQVKRATESDSIELRFRALLAADRAQLGPHLRHAVSLVASHHLPIDWSELYRAIRAWDRVDERNSKKPSPRRRWANDFWTTDGADEAQSPAQPTSTPDNEATP